MSNTSNGESRVKVFFESLVIVAILLVLVQMFLEDFAVISGWNMDVRRKLSISGFFFDLFFTIEFLVRLYYASVNRKTMHYLIRERGWIDFFASVPLLMFNSGPTTIAILLKGSTLVNVSGILNILKVIKAIRIARVLRFLRIVKIFGKIKYVESKMAQRHIANITTISITVLVFSLLGISILQSSLGLPGVESRIYGEQLKIAKAIDKLATSDEGLNRALENADMFTDTLLVVKKDGKTIYSRYGNGYYAENFGPGDYSYFAKDGLELFFDSRIVSVASSLQNIIFFIIVLLTVVAFLVFYSPHFAITVTDPLHIIERGMSEKGYNLEVKIPSAYAADDVFRVAKLYNEVFLPMKDKFSTGEEKPLLDIEMKDIQDILPKG